MSTGSDTGTETASTPSRGWGPPSEPTTLVLVRHGVTEPNFRGCRCGGDLDVPLMDIGCDQAFLLAKQIEKMHLGIGVIVTGSLIRTRQTASIGDKRETTTPSSAISGSPDLMRVMRFTKPAASNV